MDRFDFLKYFIFLTSSCVPILKEGTTIEFQALGSGQNLPCLYVTKESWTNRKVPKLCYWAIGINIICDLSRFAWSPESIRTELKWRAFRSVAGSCIMQASFLCDCKQGLKFCNETLMGNMVAVLWNSKMVFCRCWS